MKDKHEHDHSDKPISECISVSVESMLKRNSLDQLQCYCEIGITVHYDLPEDILVLMCNHRVIFMGHLSCLLRYKYPACIGTNEEKIDYFLVAVTSMIEGM